MRDDNIKVAVIDSGIDSNINGLRENIDCTKRYVLNRHGKVVETEDGMISHQHGTATALIIKHICPNVSFHSLNISDENLLSDGRILIHSINSAIKLKPDIIHLSLGTTKMRYIPQLTSLIIKALQNGIIIVSALSNDGEASYPANLMGIVKVQGYDLINTQDYYYYNGRFIAPYALTYINEMEEKDYRKFAGNSMAAAYITGHICKLMDTIGYKTEGNIIDILRQNANKLI